jgi:uncharacterized protein YgiM (DUF1202 family)
MKYYIHLIAILFTSITPYYLQAQSKNLFVSKNYILKAKASNIEEATIAPVLLGESVEILHLQEDLLNPEGDWAKIRLSDGKEGFIPFSYLQKESPPESAIKNRDVILFEPQVQYVTASNLNIRTGPGQSFDVISSIERNSEVTVYRYSDDDDYIDGLAAKWAYVKTSGYSEGWIYGGYLSLEKADSDQTPEDWEHIYKGSSKYVRTPQLRIRDEPGNLGTIIGSTTQGKSVSIVKRMSWVETIAGIRSVWVQIEVDGITGYVFGGFLSQRSGLYLSGDYLDKPFLYPLDPNRSARTSPYGYRIHPILGYKRLHTGIDLGAAIGTPIYSAGDGVVEFQQDKLKEGYGRLTVIRHENGLVTYYAHQEKMHVKRGDRVKAGDTIG